MQRAKSEKHLSAGVSCSMHRCGAVCCYQLADGMGLPSQVQREKKQAGEWRDGAWAVSALKQVESESGQDFQRNEIE